MVYPLFWILLAAAAPDTADTADRLAAIGQPAGTRATAPLAGPYEDPLQEQIPFGRRSYYLAPWRAYLDTRPAASYARFPGVNFNVHDTRLVEPLAQLLAEHGFAHGRIEVGWGSFDYDQPDRLPPDAAAALTAKLQALQRWGLRPLLLLNANSGGPVPARWFHGTLREAAPAGARELVLEDTTPVVPGRTGPRGQAYQIAYPLITAVDTATGRCTLSAPLAQPLPAGDLDLVTLRYEPFGSGPTFADGRPNPALAETIGGWRAYVDALASFCAEALDTGDPLGAGFDLEVWNELSFGSQFLEDRNYYDPPREYGSRWTYENHGRKLEGYDCLFGLTADQVTSDPQLAGVRVINGFSNQRPWDNGTDLWPTATGYSRHYYSNTTESSPDDPLVGSFDARRMTEREQTSGPLNALGQPDGEPDGLDWHTVLPDTFFVPALRRAHPEYWHYAYQTEFMTRDTTPLAGAWENHGRYTHPGNGRPAEVWMTEYNHFRAPAMHSLAPEGPGRADARYAALAHWLGAKALLRAFPFYHHKGLSAVQVYAVLAADDEFGLLPQAFIDALVAADYQLTPEVRALVGPQFEVLGRLASKLAANQPIEEARPVRVEALVEHQPRLVFRGAGDEAHPDRLHRDDFAILPYQLDAQRYALPYWVVTRDLMHVWHPTADPLDPRRYTMPDQTFDVTLANLDGRGLRASVLDLWSGVLTPIEPRARTANSVTLRLSATDSPRLLYLTEAQPGPLVSAAELTQTPTGTRLTFRPNIDGLAEITWGSWPERTDGGRRVLQVAGATTNTVDLPPLALGQAVRVTLHAGERAAPWPRWDRDVAGVVR